MHSEMSPIDWALRPLKKYAVFSGRAPRAEYWWYVLSVAVLGTVLGIADRFLLLAPAYGDHGPLGLAFMLIVAIPGFAVLVRRLHDTGRSGWWALERVPGYGFVLMGSSLVRMSAVLKQLPPWKMVVVLAAVFGWLLVELLVFVFVVSAGKRTSNRYGPDPYGPGSLEEVFA